jgi:hypothetical protein
MDWIEKDSMSGLGEGAGDKTHSVAKQYCSVVGQPLGSPTCAAKLRTNLYE